ncbi:MAG TPA: hypothetical protein VFM46_07690, partial [Pseudomonadales bacterium]|nr:hypothetical protein [Pseudomonadales bacterium]
MDTLLVLMGLSIFFAGMALYFNAALKKGVSWLLASVLFPPVVIIFHGRFWQKSKFSAYAQIVGLSLLTFGILAGVQRHPENYDYAALRPLVGWLGAKHRLADDSGTAALADV